MIESLKKEWTVFFLIKAIPAQDMANLTYLLREIEEINFDPHINMVFCINFNRIYFRQLMDYSEEIFEDNVEKEYTTMFFELKKNELGKNRLWCIGERESFDITHPDDVEVYFKKYILNMNQAHKYLLFTWDHGDGFGIFEGIGEGGRIEAHEVRSRVLTMEELSKAITQSLGSKKIDLMIMMNCQMQMIDTLYALHDNVKYLVAPQTLMWFDDYNYKKIFGLLSSEPKLTGEKLSLSIIDSFRDENRYHNNPSISACNLTDVKNLVLHLNKLAYHLLKRVKYGSTEKIIEAFATAISVDKSERFIDLYSLFKRIESFVNQEEHIIIQSLINYFDNREVVLDYFPNTGSIRHRGVTAFSPVYSTKKTKINKGLEEYTKNTSFMKNTQWGLLVSILDALF